MARSIAQSHCPDGPVYGPDGLPLAFRLFSGSENEQPSLRPLEETILRDFNLSRFIVCTDAGLASRENRMFNNEGERAYIVTQSLKTLKKHLQDWALDSKGWQLQHSDERFDLSTIDLYADSQRDLVYHKSRWIKENGWNNSSSSPSRQIPALPARLPSSRSSAPRRRWPAGQSGAEEGQRPQRFVKRLASPGMARWPRRISTIWMRGPLPRKHV
jgi:hypothetical protein